jgi:hypothetical protein
LEKVHHRFTKLIAAVKKLSYEERLRRLNLLTLEERRNRADCNEMLKMHKGLTKISFDAFFEVDRYGRIGGH